MSTIAQLTTKIKADIGKLVAYKRKLKEERVAVGKLLLELRSKFGVENTNGGFRGSRKGSFCKHLEDNGLNLGMCYAYMREAEGKPASYTARVDYWQKFNTKAKKASGAQKIVMLRAAIQHLVKLYKIPAVVTVTRELSDKQIAREWLAESDGAQQA